jgi:hypothetical protein
LSDRFAVELKVLDLVHRHGTDSLAFVAVESGMRHWFDFALPTGTGACVAYVDCGTAWVAAGAPLVDIGQRPRAAGRFVDAARASGHRACFFASDSLSGVALKRIQVGEQPIFNPAAWLVELPGHRRLREQLRRARAKGVIVQWVDPSDLRDGTALRSDVSRLRDEWLGSRRMEPMNFVVAAQPFQHPTEHRYFVARRDGALVAFLSAVPIGRRGWLVEDLFRSGLAPNGTTELMIHALMQEVVGSEYVTLGPTPLAGEVPRLLRLARWVARPLFDFAGLRSFRERLHPQAWKPVWLVFPAAQSPFSTIVDVLRAFASGSLLRFAGKSLLRRPSALCWALALPLPPWTTALACIAALDCGMLLGFSRITLVLWTLFDGGLLWALLRAAVRPQRTNLVLVAALASGDAALSLAHLTSVGFGRTGSEISLRAAATVAPLVGAMVLASLAWRARTALHHDYRAAA